MRKVAALALVLALTGCAAEIPAPSITPVNLKYCALSDSAGFDDDGLNRSVYAALQQLKIQTGAAVMAIEASQELAPNEGIQKLVDANCDLIITAGLGLVSPALQAAKQNSSIRFFAVSDIVNTESAASNFSAITFNIHQAAFAAGYLAASETENGAEIAILDLLKTSVSKKSIKAFTAGVARFNTANRSRVKLKAISSMQSAAQEVVFVLAGNGSKLGTTKAKIIGYGRDWYEDQRNEEILPNILTSVMRIDAMGKVATAVTSNSMSVNFDLTNGGVGLAPAHDLIFPASFSGELERIIEDLVQGKIKVG